ncbi:photosystem II assembly protein Psb35 [Altericista sp. CCNU0014]|uniref:photosystem II assembly protein Psb35 n=1 Tax=Altericista sp. CCNU0014 TaxID=3082949 RepID=UPI00384C8D27
MLNTPIVQWLATMAEAAETSNQFGAALLPTVMVLGFVAAAGLGSVAWYNSKRPVGWEDKERPDFVPEVEESETPGLGNP